MLNKYSVEQDDEETLVDIRNVCREYLYNHKICVPAAWLLKGESEDETVDPNDGRENLEKIIHSPDFYVAADKKAFFEVCRLSDDEILKIAALTVGQRSNELYLRYKKYRITASNFGYVVGALSRNSYPPSLYGRLVNTANLEKVSSHFLPSHRRKYPSSCGTL